MCGWVAADAKVARRLYNRTAEMVQPNTIDPHTGRQRILAIDNSLSQVKPAAAVLERLPVFAGDDRGELAWHHLAWSVRVASQEDARWRDRRRVFQNQRTGRRAGTGRSPRIHGRSKLAQLFLRRS